MAESMDQEVTALSVEASVEVSIEAGRTTHVVCGHCKFTCQDIEELKEHIRANHLNTINLPVSDDGLESSPQKQPVTETRKQTVVVYKQQADGSTVNTGQVVQLTQSQIVQLLNNGATSSQKPVDIATPTPQQQSNGGVYMPLQGSSMSTGGKKQLLVVGAENMETLERTAKTSAASATAVKARPPPPSSAAARVSLLSAGIPQFVSKQYPEGEDEGVIELKFRFTTTAKADMIGEHIKPTVSFLCQYCGYRDSSYAKACVHARNFHLSEEGKVISSTKLVERPEAINESILTTEDLTCPYCLIQFFTVDDRDFHRLKKCGPKQRYEVKRTAVRSLQKHLICPANTCTRALYFGDHPSVIKHPRATFGSCHRNNGPAHYFSCYVCASESPDEWKKLSEKQLESIVVEKVKAFNEKLRALENDANKQEDTTSTLVEEKASPAGTDDEESNLATMSDGEEKKEDVKDGEPPPPLPPLKVLVQPEDMRSWDFKTWKECAAHLASEHPEVVALQPQCSTCKKPFTSCNHLCQHVFNNQVEYIDNTLQNLRRRESKKAAKKGLIFGLTKESPADRMVLNESSCSDIAAGAATDKDNQTGEVKVRHTVRNRHFMCRTCGQGFSSAAKRDKHILSNACVRERLEKIHDCSVCKKKFTTRKTLVSHETWCLYKQKRDALNPPAAKAATDSSPADDTGDITDTLTTIADDDQTSSKTDSLAAVEKREKKKRAVNFKCTIQGCIMGFHTTSELDVHTRCHIGTSVAYQCCFCDFSPAATVNWYPLKEHIIAKHPGNIPPDFECPICVKGFAKQSKFDDHMTKHSSERVHKCIECSVSFKQESGLRTHVQYEHGTEEAKEYARLAVKQRTADNHVIQPLLCYVCGYSTNSRSYYKTHMNIHKGVKPYSCKYCDYKSVDGTCFKRHMWRHQDAKPYKCIYCPFDGIQRAQIVAHMRSKHNVWPEVAKKLIKHVSGRSASNIQKTQSPKEVITTRSVVVDNISELTEPDSLEVENTTTVSIVNPDGSETTIPVELITQAAQGLAAGTNVQVAYGDYMINYTLEKPRDEEPMDETETLLLQQPVAVTEHEQDQPEVQ